MRASRVCAHGATGRGEIHNFHCSFAQRQLRQRTGSRRDTYRRARGVARSALRECDVRQSVADLLKSKGRYEDNCRKVCLGDTRTGRAETVPKAETRTQTHGYSRDVRPRGARPQERLLRLAFGGASAPGGHGAEEHTLTACTRSALRAWLWATLRWRGSSVKEAVRDAMYGLRQGRAELGEAGPWTKLRIYRGALLNSPCRVAPTR